MALTTTPAVGADIAGEVIDIPVPLDEPTWRGLLALPPDADLFARLVTDRAALLLAAGLTAADPSIRALVHRDRDLLTFLYREGHGSLLLVARALAVRDGQIAVPGGDTGRVVWARLAGQPPSAPASFIRALLTRDRGRLAWYYDAIHGLDDTRLAAAWPGPSPDARVSHALELYGVFRETDGHWRAADQPFRRAPADAWSVLALTDIADGLPAGSMPAGVWDRLFTLEPMDLEEAGQRLARGGPRLTLPGLVRAIALTPPRDRLVQFEMFRLYQRVFARDPNHRPIAAAVSGYGRFPALLTALERGAIAEPDTWARAVTAAAHVSDRADHTREALIAFQAAVAIVDRLRHVGTLDTAATTRAIAALSEAVVKDRDATTAVARWILDDLLPLVAPLERPDAFTGATAYESRLLQALPGVRSTRAQIVEWEGLTYVVDLAGAEHARLYAIRKLVPSPGLDAAIASRRPRDLADALLATVYAIALGHPDGAASLGRDVATRHDFGLRSSSLMRRVIPWSAPEERQGHGPWHVIGSIIGLDSGLSRLMLRRVADEQLPPAPTLTLNDFATLTRTLAAFVARELTDADRDAIAVAIARGRQRVLDAHDDSTQLAELAREVRMSAATRELLPWLVARQPESVEDCFSLRDLLWLGRVPTAVALDRWGIAGDALDGRRTLLMPAPAPWEDFAGRPDAGQITTQVPDVTLRLVEETARLQLPATIIPALLAYAIEDYWHDVQVRFADDWPRLIRQAAAIERSRIEDYVAALVGDGVLRPQ
jgi:hypothetical protein